MIEQTMNPENTFWKSAGHQSRFVENMQRRGKTWPEAGGKFDPEYGAALYILTADTGTWNRTEKYVSRSGIDFEAMLEEVDFSGGYVRLVRLAGHLFNEQQQLLPIELLHLDQENFLLALDAIKLRRYGFRLS
jgi:hypothetical protein